MEQKIISGGSSEYSRCRSNQARRTFLKIAGGMAGALAVGGFPVSGESASFDEKPEDASSAAGMPSIQIGDYSVSRMVLGANPVWGYSYQGKMLSKLMVQYYNDDNIVKLLHDSERAGITAWQTNFDKRTPGVWKRYRDEGGSMHLIILHQKSGKPIREIAAAKPIAIVHHGGVTDRFWVNRQMDKVHDFVKEVKDAGIMAGVSCHKPEVLEKISQDNWENDLFMACFYQMTRTPEEWEKMIGFKPFQYIFHGNDPRRMCSAIRSASRPVLAFKILAGGWAADRKGQAEEAFKFAFGNIKASDGVIVGMLPVYEDQVNENAKYTVKYGRSV